mmetsp:Transcript_31889/g.78037  ORF Transcript_31889/g.78037 Transcript_31889/m.78037 type:complete len:207 (-) Transcript_31889:351-971(-)
MQSLGSEVCTLSIRAPAPFSFWYDLSGNTTHRLSKNLFWFCCGTSCPTPDVPVIGMLNALKKDGEKFWFKPAGLYFEILVKEEPAAFTLACPVCPTTPMLVPSFLQIESVRWMSGAPMIIFFFPSQNSKRHPPPHLGAIRSTSSERSGKLVSSSSKNLEGKAKTTAKAESATMRNRALFIFPWAFETCRQLASSGLTLVFLFCFQL